MKHKVSKKAASLNSTLNRRCELDGSMFDDIATAHLNAKGRGILRRDFCDRLYPRLDAMIESVSDAKKAGILEDCNRNAVDLLDLLNRAAGCVAVINGTSTHAAA